MTADREGDSALSRYLRPGAAQEQLVELMGDGHANLRHGGQLGDHTVDEFKAVARAHLRSATDAFEMRDPKDNRLFLVTDRTTGRIAWIPTHKPRRATVFAPDGGVDGFVARKHALFRDRGWRAVDVASIRSAPARTRHRGITSAARGPSTQRTAVRD